ncbi:alpha/beta fold hydrolase [Undibacterium fentianense]|uniref:Alpha/beta hydrolase n=1 Tax=Undibacterium fentianense TaxID=2828728 RepID=A0A941E5L1_9BURK|nr:alpha/beta hydrolase [Undibacterium fentianense]MBR7801577.1 alpha/beta hydrolase [Undibacterium fentianense]
MSDFKDIYFTSKDGLRLYARDYPMQQAKSSLPVVCIHGLTRNSADFDELAPWLASLGRRVIAVDVRGRGKSEHAVKVDHYHPWVYANDIVSLCQHLQISQAIFIGTSMGGLITMTLALRKQGLIAAAILNDVGPVLSVKGLNRIASYAGGGNRFQNWDEARTYIKEINQSAFPNNSDAEWDKWARRAFAMNPQGQLELQYDPLIAMPLKTGKLKATSWLIRWAFRRLTKRRPCLLVRGAISDLLEPTQAEMMRQMAPNLDYVEVPEVGHAPMLTEQAAKQAIQTFLEKLA